MKVQDVGGEPAGRAPTVPTGDPLMIAKLDVPEPDPRTLLRPRLVDRVSAGVAGRMTVVCAPAGTGKTTLLRSWLSSAPAPGPVAWVNLDDGDRQPGVFWAYLLTALSRAGVSVTGVERPDRPDRLDPSFLVRLSAALYGRPEPAVVVLDDADVLADVPVFGQLDFLIRHTGAALRLVVLTRADPVMQLPRYRLAGTVTEIREAELAATADEARALLGLHGIRLPAETLGVLLARTRGWMAGLVLTGLALQDHPELARRPRALAGEGSDIGEYLDEEVLRAQPPGVRRFLVRTSVANHLPASLAVDLSGQRRAARLLAELARRNAFVTRCERHADCYRYHPLFQELLRSRLDEDSPGAARQLHRRASAWFVAAAEQTEGAMHAAAAADWGTAARILVGGLAIPRLRTGRRSDRLAWLFADLPADTPGAEAAVVLAAMALNRRDTAACAAHLERARDLAEQAQAGQAQAGQAQAGQAQHANAVALAVCLVAAGLAAMTGDAEAALAAAGTTESLLGELGGATPVPETRALVLCDAGEALLRAGRLDAAAAVLAEARAALAPGCEHLRPACDSLLALVEALRGRLRRAAELAGPEPDLAAGGTPAVARRPVAADIALAWVAIETADQATARRHAAAAVAGDPHDLVLTAILVIVHARLHRTDGDPAAALAVLTDARDAADTDPLPRWLDGRLAAVAAATWSATGRPDMASRCLAEVRPDAVPEAALELAWARLARGETGDGASTVAGLLHRADLTLDVRVDGWLLRAAEALDRGNPAAARTAADRALRAAAPERLRRPILEAPPRLRGFLRHETNLAAVHRWLDEADPPGLTRVQGTVDGQPAAGLVLVEPLTEKEHEVLVYLGELLSTQEIAQKMFVSVNTVKTHIRGILRKLVASRRNEAIRRAREMQLI
jgi:LuxR family maltose regulon positive regulatory protein